MMSLSIAESETPALKVTANTSPGNCGHRVITYEIDGASKTLAVHNDDLAAAGTDQAERDLVIAWLRYRRSRGKPEVGVRIV